MAVSIDNSAALKEVNGLTSMFQDFSGATKGSRFQLINDRFVQLSPHARVNWLTGYENGENYSKHLAQATDKVVKTLDLLKGKGVDSKVKDFFANFELLKSNISIVQGSYKGDTAEFVKVATEQLFQKVDAKYNEFFPSSSSISAAAAASVANSSLTLSTASIDSISSDSDDDSSSLALSTASIDSISSDSDDDSSSLALSSASIDSISSDSDDDSSSLSSFSSVSSSSISASSDVANSSKAATVKPAPAAKKHELPITGFAAKVLNKQRAEQTDKKETKLHQQRRNGVLRRNRILPNSADFRHLSRPGKK